MFVDAYEVFVKTLQRLRRQFETSKGKAREDEEIRIVGYRMELIEEYEMGGLWRAQFLAIINTADEYGSVRHVLEELGEMLVDLTALGVMLEVKSLTSLDDVTPSKRKAIAMEIETIWQS